MRTETDEAIIVLHLYIVIILTKFKPDNKIYSMISQITLIT